MLVGGEGMGGREGGREQRENGKRERYCRRGTLRERTKEGRMDGRILNQERKEADGPGGP